MEGQGVQREKSGRFGAGNPGKPKGAVSKTTKTLKEAILLAAEQVGLKRKPNAENGLVAYLESIAETNDSALCGLLGKVLPMTIQGGDGTKDGEPIVIHLHAGPRDKV